MCGHRLFFFVHMVNVSKISPLLFDVRYDDIEMDREYVQKFWRQDNVIIQCVVFPSSNVQMTIQDLTTGGAKDVPSVSHEINEFNKLVEFTLPYGDSVYSAILSDGIIKSTSGPFRFCEDFRGMARIVYTNSNNITSFGAVFNINGVKREFAIVLEAGFKSDGRTLNVDNEQFRTQGQEIVELYAVPYETEKLTIGNNEGVPFEMARLINNIFCLSDVRINYTRYVRSESSVPEQQVIAEGYPLFNYTLNVENAENVSYNGFTEYTDGTGIIGSVSFDVSEAKDGQVLVFKGDSGSFVNQSNLDSL